ncbi:MAG: TatD family hydrolase [Gammaproteobacteria bacterium]|nr:TatD family hydrolase [Gammaproteobacteria bacterium]
MWTDICVNLSNKQFEKDAREVIERAIHSGVTRMLIVGTDLEHSLEALKWAEQYPDFLRCTAGCHPHDAKTMNSESWNDLESLFSSPLVVAVGECGLDFNRNFSEPDVQVEVFTKQLYLAEKYSLPVYLHERDAHQEMIRILQQFQNRLTTKVIHCFTGNKDQAMSYLEQDCYIGVTGWICDERRNHDLIDALSIIPKDRLMLETDAPYLIPRNLTPKPKSRRCEPMHIVTVGDTVAKLRGVSSHDLAKQTTSNSARFFNWQIKDINN